jgi:hypothetical protein
LQTNIALFVSENNFQFHEYHITIPTFEVWVSWKQTYCT